MKKRRTFLSLFMLASLAFVGVGYAALTRNLSVDTNLKADANNHNLNVKFHSDIMGYKLEKGDKTKITVGVGPIVNNPQAASVTITGLSGYEDEVTVYLLVVNESDMSENLHAVLTNPSVTVSHSTTNEASVDKDGNITDGSFRGNHFVINTEYVYGSEVTVDSTSGEKTLTYDYMGEVKTVEGKKVPYLETKTSAKGSVGEGVWLKINYKLVNVVTDSFDVHKVTVSFSANSTTKIA